MTERMEHVEVARARSDRGEVVLRRRLASATASGNPDVLELRVNGVYVMDSVETTSETALARARSLLPEGAKERAFWTETTAADGEMRVEAVVEAEMNIAVDAETLRRGAG